MDVQEGGGSKGWSESENAFPQAARPTLRVILPACACVLQAFGAERGNHQ